MKNFKGTVLLKSVTAFKKDIYELIPKLIKSNDVIELKGKSGNAYVISEEKLNYYEDSMELLRDLLIEKELKIRNSKPRVMGNTRLENLEREVDPELMDRQFKEMF